MKKSRLISRDFDGYISTMSKYSRDADDKKKVYEPTMNRLALR